MIRILRNKKGQFFVRHTGANNEPLSNSETFTTKQSAWKNIIAHCKLYDSSGVDVKDMTTGKVYNLFQEGSKWLKHEVIEKSKPSKQAVN